MRFTTEYLLSNTWDLHMAHLFLDAEPLIPSYLGLKLEISNMKFGLIFTHCKKQMTLKLGSYLLAEN